MMKKLEELKALALAATPGPWAAMHRYHYSNKKWEGAEIESLPKQVTRKIKTYTGEIREITDNYYVCGNYNYEEGGVCSTKDDADYIAAANPAIILALIKAVEALGGVIKEADRETIAFQKARQALEAIEKEMG